MACHSILWWWIMECHCILWWIMACHCILWWIMACHCILWLIMACHCILWWIKACHCIRSTRGMKVAHTQALPALYLKYNTVNNYWTEDCTALYLMVWWVNGETRKITITKTAVVKNTAYLNIYIWMISHFWGTSKCYLYNMICVTNTVSAPVLPRVGCRTPLHHNKSGCHLSTTVSLSTFCL